jgi:hypothetical protein
MTRNPDTFGRQPLDLRPRASSKSPSRRNGMAADPNHPVPDQQAVPSELMTGKYRLAEVSESMTAATTACPAPHPQYDFMSSLCRATAECDRSKVQSVSRLVGGATHSASMCVSLVLNCSCLTRFGDKLFYVEVGWTSQTRCLSHIVFLINLNTPCCTTICLSKVLLRVVSSIELSNAFVKMHIQT